MVACTNACGEPDLYFVIISCSEEQYNNGDHYQYTELCAMDEGYEGPFVCFDENDSAGKALLHLFAWNTSKIVARI